MFNGRINRNNRGGEIIDQPHETFLQSALLRHEIEKRYGVEVLGAFMENHKYFCDGSTTFWQLLPESVDESFTWIDTLEGHDYWQNIHEEISGEKWQ